MNKTINIYNRTLDLEERLNQFLQNLTNTKNNYFESLSQKQLIELKSTLSDINNVLTLKTTMSFSYWLSKYFKFTKSEEIELINKINSSKPNSNGFDIELTNRFNIIAEIKCIIPINQGTYYGAAQRNSILDDAVKLKYGKRTISNTSEFYKIIGIIDLGEKTDIALKKLTKPAKNIRTKNEIRLKRHNIVPYLKIISSKTIVENFSTDFVYIKKVVL